MHGASIGSARARWPGAHGPTTCLITSDLLMPGWPPEAGSSPLVGGASRGGRFQFVKSGKVRPSGGILCSDASAVAVSGVVGPPVEAATPCPWNLLHHLTPCFGRSPLVGSQARAPGAWPTAESAEAYPRGGLQ